MKKIWDIVMRSRYNCVSIDGRAVNLTKTRPDIWSRDDLIHEIGRLTSTEAKNSYKFPYRLSKPHLSRAVIFLRGMRRLEERLAEKMIGVNSDRCSICQESLWRKYGSVPFVPLFRHSYSSKNKRFVVAYHIVCISQWLWISHNFTDPVSRILYTNKELSRIDKLEKNAHIIHERTILDLKNDPETQQRDAQEREQEERAELTVERIEGFVRLMRDQDSFDTIYTYVRTFFRRLAAIDTELAIETIERLIAQRMDMVGPIQSIVLEFLLEISEAVHEWGEEDEYDLEEDEDVDIHDIRVLSDAFTSFIGHMANAFHQQTSIPALPQNTENAVILPVERVRSSSLVSPVLSHVPAFPLLLDSMAGLVSEVSPFSFSSLMGEQTLSHPLVTSPPSLQPRVASVASASVEQASSSSCESHEAASPFALHDLARNPDFPVRRRAARGDEERARLTSQPEHAAPVHGRDEVHALRTEPVEPTLPRLPG